MKKLTLDERKDMASTIQRSINSIWESKVIDYLITTEKSNTEIDIEYVNTLIDTYSEIEKSFEEVMKKFSLGIQPEKPLKGSKYRNVPRRFKIVLDSSHRNGLNNKLKKYYKLNANNSIEKYRGIMSICNAYQNTLQLDSEMNYNASENIFCSDIQRLKLISIMKDKNGDTIAYFENLSNNTQSSINLDSHYFKLKNILLNNKKREKNKNEK